MKYDNNGALVEAAIDGLPEPRRGKVRDMFDFGDTLLMVATDRISAFDCVMPNGIPDKGRVLTAMSRFWFDLLDWMPNHLITMNVDEYPDATRPYATDLDGRSMLVHKTEPFPVECVARGYLIGSGWKDYQKSGTVCGIELPAGHVMADRLATPIYTPAFKAEFGEHDENITFAKVIELVGSDVATDLRERTLKLYSAAAEYAAEHGIIIADTKFEFGMHNGDIILIDEVLTPDSSRFWPADQYEVGSNPPNLDKQFLRDYLETQDWNKEPPAPELPGEIVNKTRDRYFQAFEQLTGMPLPETGVTHTAQS